MNNGTTVLADYKEIQSFVNIFKSMDKADELQVILQSNEELDAIVVDIQLKKQIEDTIYFPIHCFQTFEATHTEPLCIKWKYMDLLALLSGVMTSARAINKLTLQTSNKNTAFVTVDYGSYDGTTFEPYGQEQVPNSEPADLSTLPYKVALGILNFQHDKATGIYIEGKKCDLKFELNKGGSTKELHDVLQAISPNSKYQLDVSVSYWDSIVVETVVEPPAPPAPVVQTPSVTTKVTEATQEPPAPQVPAKTRKTRTPKPATSSPTETSKEDKGNDQVTTETSTATPENITPEETPTAPVTPTVSTPPETPVAPVVKPARKKRRNAEEKHADMVSAAKELLMAEGYVLSGDPAAEAAQKPVTELLSDALLECTAKLKLITELSKNMQSGAPVKTEEELLQGLDQSALMAEVARRMQG